MEEKLVQRLPKALSVRGSLPGNWETEFFTIWSEYVYSLSPLVKDASWQWEQEYRIVHKYEDCQLEMLDFSQKNTMLSRYLDLPFTPPGEDKTPRLPIRQVMVGPGSNFEFVKASVELLLKKHSYSEVEVLNTGCSLTEP